MGSFITPLQPLYERLHISREIDPQTKAKIDSWEKRTNLKFPKVLAEFYSMNCSIPMTVEDQEWKISFFNLWSEYTDGTLNSLDEMLDHYEKSTNENFDKVQISKVFAFPADGKSYVFLESDAHGINWAFLEKDGSDDPMVHEYSRQTNGWHSEKYPFSEWLFNIFNDFGQHNYVPKSFWGFEADIEKSEECAPLNLHANGLWLRAFAKPLTSDEVSSLKTLYPDHSELAVDLGFHAYMFHTDDGLIRIKTDPEGHPGGRSAWWIAAATPEVLSSLYHSVAKMSDLEKHVRAGSDQGRAFLESLK